MAEYSVFTKPWNSVSASELVDIVAQMGFNAIEFPLRDGAQVCPAEAEKKLPALVELFARANIRVDDVASTPEERVFAACAACGIHMIRVMYIPPRADDYIKQEAEYINQVDAWLKLCEKYGVMIGVQMHQGRGATSAADMMRIIGRFDPKYIGAIWDAAHSGLAGENTEQAIDLCLSHLCLVNFKNARYQALGRGEDGAQIYSSYFCAGADGLTSWPRAVAHLKRKGYSGTWCMPAEYSGLSEADVIKYATRDLKWLKSLVEC